MFIKRQDLEYASYLKLMESDEFNIKEKSELIKLIPKSEDKTLCEWIMDKDLNEGQDHEKEMKKFIYEKQFDFDTKEMVIDTLLEQGWTGVKQKFNKTFPAFGYQTAGSAVKGAVKKAVLKHSPVLNKLAPENRPWNKRKKELFKARALVGGVAVAGIAGIAYLMQKYGVCTKHCDPSLVKRVLTLGTLENGEAEKIYRISCNLNCKIRYNEDMLVKAHKDGDRVKASELTIRIQKYHNDMNSMAVRVKEIENRLKSEKNNDGATAVRKAFEMATQRNA